MKIVHITPYFKEYLAGQEKFVYNLCRELASIGFDVWVLTSGLCTKGVMFETIDNIKVLRHQRVFTIMRTPITPSIIRSILSNSDAQIMHAHNFYHSQTWFVYMLKTLANLKPKLVLHEHGILSLGYSLYDIAVRTYEYTVLKKILESFDAIIFLSKHSLETLERRTKFKYEDKSIHIIPNAINIDYFLNKARNVDETLAYKVLCKKFRHNTNIDRKLKLLFVGPVIKRKGIDLLLKTVDILVNKLGYRNLLLIIVGSGDQITNAIRFTYSHGLKDYVYIVGSVTEEQLISLYKFCDAVILPSRAEGVPTTIIEALSLGKPVIASPIPSILEYFRSYIEIIHIDNPYSMALKLRKFMEYPYKIKEIREKALKAPTYVRRKFNIKYVARTIARIYENIT